MIDWDYTELARAYLKRPDYAGSVIDDLLDRASLKPGAPCCDVGAGVGHLTLMLADRGLLVTAVEPNQAMRVLGLERTRGVESIKWVQGTGEATRLDRELFSLVAFGSSFNVTDRPRALMESWRILKPGGWFACLWNHRVLTDPVQERIEAIIHATVPGYAYGTRREDQTAIIQQCGLFGPVTYLEGTVSHRQPIVDIVEAWRSHATLYRQAGSTFATVITRIENYLNGLGTFAINVPYTTRLWTAQRRP